MKKLLGILILPFLLSSCQSMSNMVSSTDVAKVNMQQEDQKISNLFSEAKTTGVITIFDGTSYNSFGNDKVRANTRYVPASTFKMLNALIGIEHGLTSPDEVYKWDGKKRLFPVWEKDMTLTEAIGASAIPLYQELAKRIGLSLMQSEVKRIGFGNSNIGTKVDDFWLVGPLMITPREEAEFAYKLANNQLPVSEKSQKQVQQMIFADEINGSKIYSKSGWGWDVDPQVGWLTGWVVKPDGKIVSFSLNIEMRKDIPSAARKEITYAALKELKII